VVQQEPVGGWGQGFGLQLPPSSHTLGGWQFANVITEQPPLVVQHDPVAGGGWGQKFGLQPPLSSHTFGG
jgi:hypothetical protein